MHLRYKDIIERIDEPPVWYMTNGVPRWSDMDDAAESVYARYTVYFTVVCQDCNESFIIGQDFGTRDLYYQDTLERGWVSLLDGLYLTPSTEPKRYVTLTPDYLMAGSVIGDPPNHGCIGDTMSSVDGNIVHFIDHRHGEVVEDGKIIKLGTKAIIEEHSGRAVSFYQEKIGNDIQQYLENLYHEQNSS